MNAGQGLKLRCQDHVKVQFFELYSTFPTSLFYYFSTSDLFSSMFKLILRYNILFFFCCS